MQYCNLYLLMIQKCDNHNTSCQMKRSKRTCGILSQLTLQGRTDLNNLHSWSESSLFNVGKTRFRDSEARL